MAYRTYQCSIFSNSALEDRTYMINHRSAVKAAEKYGRAESGETIIVRTHTGKILSKAIWDPQQKKYISVNFD